MKRIFLIGFLISAFGLFSPATLAQATDDDPMSGGATISSGNTDNTLVGTSAASSNVGEFVIDWVARGADFANPESTLFGAISLILNSICLAFLIIVTGKHGLQYVTAMMTKGVPGGGQIAGGVTAIRFTLAVGMLCPIVGNGFSPVQVLVKNMAETGAWVGDKGVEAATGYLSGDEKYGGGSATVTPPMLFGMDQVVEQVFIAEACHLALDNYYSYDKSLGYIPTDADASPFNIGYTDEVITYSWGWRDLGSRSAVSGVDQSGATACGSVNLAIPSKLTGLVTMNGSSLEFGDVPAEYGVFRDILTIHHNAIITLKSSMQNSLNKLLEDQLLLTTASAMRSSGELDPAQIEQLFAQIANIEAKIPSQIPVISKEMLAANSTYVNAIRSQGVAAAQYVAQYKQGNSENGTWQQELNSQGFAALGGYYWLQMKVNLRTMEVQKHLASAGDTPLFVTQDENNPLLFLQNHALFPLMIERIATVRSAYLATRQPSEFEFSFTAMKYADDMDADDRGLGGKIMAKINQYSTAIIDFAESSLLESTNRDIIVNMMLMGSIIVGILEGILIAFAVGSIAVPALKFLSGPAGMVAGKLASLSGFTDILFGAIKAVMPLLIAGLVLGVTMQYIFPAIPMIKWLVSLQSWAIMIFIGMIYGPIWMLATGAGTGENWVEGKAYDGFVFMTELLLRPILMVFGFYAAMMLMVVADIGARMAWPYFVGLGREGFLGPIGMLVVLALSIFVVYKLIVRTFDLVHELPDFVLERLGARPLGDAARDDTAGNMVVAWQKTQGAGMDSVTSDAVKSGAGQMKGGIAGVGKSIAEGFKQAFQKSNSNDQTSGDSTGVSTEGTASSSTDSTGSLETRSGDANALASTSKSKSDTDKEPT